MRRDANGGKPGKSKLSLNKETIRELQTGELANGNGAIELLEPIPVRGVIIFRAPTTIGMTEICC
jgi:hypothetical protein